MTETKLLVGSLSNDLFRVATLTQRGSYKAAARFLQEAKRWSTQLSTKNVRPYIKRISEEILAESEDSFTMEQAEKHLTYGVLLQNYALHIK